MRARPFPFSTPNASSTSTLPSFFLHFTRLPHFQSLPISFLPPDSLKVSTFSSLIAAKPMSTSATAVPPVHVKESIELNHKEKQIFNRLLGAVRHFDLPLQLRVAGGWVRDKLLGKECYDIDIALNDMSGEAFVKKFNEYLASSGEEALGFAVIASNPDQSKHLETARMRLYDVWVDFVNLRSETYSENSGIPTEMKFETAEEDAYRRDLTINSMFYNINSNSIEDFTGRGLEDLKYGRIVTPLPPKETFLDDPLRVLRAIRFGARFKFTLDEKLKEAAASDDVREALATKISRERIGTEVDLMIAGNEPVKAVSYIFELRLFWVVFGLPPSQEPSLPEDCDRLCLAHLNAASNLLELLKLTFSDEQRRLSLYAALFSPLRMITYKYNKSKKVPIVNYIFRNSLKRKVNDSETVVGVHSAVEKFLDLIPLLEKSADCLLDDVNHGIEIADVPASSKLRVLTGFLLREVKGFWRVALLISMLSYPSGICSHEDSLDEKMLQRRRLVFTAVENAITGLGLDEVWEAKPLLNGKDIMNVLQLNRAVPLLGNGKTKCSLGSSRTHPEVPMNV